MSRRAANKRINKRPFIFTVDTNYAGGASNQFIVPTRTSSHTYNYTVETDDGYFASGITGNHTITFPSGAGIHRIKITGQFPMIFFRNEVTGDTNTTDRLRITKIDQWGDIFTSVDFSFAFHTCSNLSVLAEDVQVLGIITSAQQMFANCSGLVYLPNTFSLKNLWSAIGVFTDCPNILEIPRSLTMSGWGNASGAFVRNRKITTLHDNLDFTQMGIGSSLVRECPITSINTRLIMPALTQGDFMFRASTIPTLTYSQMLIDLRDYNSHNNVPFHGGNSKYNGDGLIARNALVARGWNITDGGLE